MRITSDQGDNRLRLAYTSRGVRRVADLSAAAEATLTFSYRRSGFDDANDWVDVEVSPDGATWYFLERIAGPTNDGSYLAAQHDVSAFAAAATTIRFTTSPNLGYSDYLWVDDVQIAYEVPAAGAGVDPSPAPLDFAATDLGSPATIPLTLTHTGTGADPDVTVTGVTVAGLHGADFTTDFSGSLVVPAAGTAPLNVTFDPGAELDRWATLRLDHDGANSPSYVLLLGRGARPNMRHASDAFGQQIYANDDGTVPWAGDWVEVGDSGGATGGYVKVDAGTLRMAWVNRSISRPVDLSSAVDAWLNFDYLRYSFDDANDYVLVEATADGVNWVELDRFAGPANDAVYLPASYDLTPYASAGTQVRFSTSATLSSSDLFRVDDLAVHYTLVPSPALDPAPNTVTFTATDIATTSQQPVTLTNLGTGNDPFVAVHSVTFTGADAADFSYAAGGHVTIEPGTGTGIAIDFSPTVTGAKSASAVIEHSGASSPITIPLSGTAVDPSLVATPDAMAPTMQAGTVLRLGTALGTTSATASYTASSSAGWLILDQTAGTTPDTLAFTVDGTGPRRRPR